MDGSHVPDDVNQACHRFTTTSQPDQHAHWSHFVEHITPRGVWGVGCGVWGVGCGVQSWANASEMREKWSENDAQYPYQLVVLTDSQYPVQPPQPPAGGTELSWHLQTQHRIGWQSSYFTNQQRDQNSARKRPGRAACVMQWRSREIRETWSKSMSKSLYFSLP